MASASTRRLGPEPEAPLLQVEKLIKRFPVRGGVFGRTRAFVHAIDGVSFALGAGETLGIVGESGCGKSTLARAIVGLVRPDAGTIRLRGTAISGLSRRQMRPFRREIQFVFQDPYASLNPRLRAGSIVGEALENFADLRGRALADRVATLFTRVGLHPGQMDKFPHEFSGGQRQRLGIARALAVGPGLIVADEPVSALDVSVQAQILNLLTELRRDLGLTYLLISHNLAVVEYMATDIAVMHLGGIVEHRPADELLSKPSHPYTRLLLASVLAPEPGREIPELRIHD